MPYYLVHSYQVLLLRGIDKNDNTARRYIMSSPPLAVNDAVYVVRESSTGPTPNRLEGVVLFRGPVKFASGDDWVGVRLTGPSAGQGKNDGSVKDVRYFDAPPSCGIFVREAAVEKRALNKLEELKLKRELMKSGVKGTASTRGGAAAGASGLRSPARTLSGDSTGGAGSKIAAAASATPPPSSASKASAAVTTAPPAASAAGTAETASGGKKTLSKLEELRQRRAALNARKQEVAAGSATTQQHAALSRASSESSASSGIQVDTKAATATSAGAAASLASPSASSALRSPVAAGTPTTAAAASTPKTTSSATAVLLQQELDKVKGELNARREDCDSMREQLKQAQEQAHQAQEQVRRLEKEQADAVAAARSSPVPEEPAAAPQQDDQLVSELRNELDTSRQQIQRLEEQIDEQSGRFQDDLAKAQSQIHALQHQVDDSTARGETTTQHYKEKAKLQAETAASNRRLAQLEGEIVNLENTIEDLTLDKEQILQEKEELEDILEEVKYVPFFIHQHFRIHHRSLSHLPVLL